MRGYLLEYNFRRRVFRVDSGDISDRGMFNFLNFVCNSLITERRDEVSLKVPSKTSNSID